MSWSVSAHNIRHAFGLYLLWRRLRRVERLRLAAWVQEQARQPCESSPVSTIHGPVGCQHKARDSVDESFG